MNAIRLRRMILETAEHVPFYRRHWAAAGVDLTRLASAVHLEFLPVVTRADLQASPAEERVDRRYLREVMQAAPAQGVDVPLDAGTMRRRQRRFRRALFDIGYRFGERVLLVAPPVHSVSALFMRWTYVDPAEGDDAVFARYGKVRPHVLYAPLRTLVLLARRLVNSPQVTWRPRLLVSTGEQLTEANRALLESAFNAKVADFYCTPEHGLLAYTKPWSTGYELLKDEFHFELLPATGAREGLHRLVVTDLESSSAPLIRFDTGDLVSAVGFEAPAHARAVAPAPSHAAARATILGIGSREPESLELNDGTWLTPEEVALALERNATAQAAAAEAAPSTARGAVVRELPAREARPRDITSSIDHTVAASAAR